MTPFPLSGLSPDPHDGRDFKFTSGVAGLPASVDLRGYCLPVENQGNTNSCTANAGTSACEVLMSRAGNAVNLSRLFLYFNERNVYPELRGRDGGAYMRDICDSLHYYGVCPEALWPFDQAKVNDTPTNECYQVAGNYPVNRYERIEITGEAEGLVKSALAKGYPVLLGAWIKEAFFSVSGPLNSHAAYFDACDYIRKASIGSHAMCIVGYTKDYFIVLNSWGEGWGDGGYWAMPFDWLRWSVHDLWVITKFGNVDLPDLWSPAPVIVNPDPVIVTPEPVIVTPDPEPAPPPEPQYDPVRKTAIRAYLDDAFAPAIQAQKDNGVSNFEIESAMGWMTNAWWMLTNVVPRPTPGPFDYVRAEAIRVYLKTLFTNIHNDQVKYDVTDGEMDNVFNSAGFWAHVMSRI